MYEDKKKVFAEYKKEISEALNDLKTRGRRHRQIPNVLTLLRMTAPFFIIPSILVGNVALSIGLIAGFSLTDAADGFIARKFNLTSDLGKDLDAICDKIFAGTLLLSASISNPLLLFNLGLEGIISAINAKKKLQGEDPKSTMMGKIKTWSLFILAGAGLLTPCLPITNVLNTLMVTTAGLQLLTIASYSKKKKGKDTEELKPILKEEPSTTIDHEEEKEKEKVLTINKEPTLEELIEMRDFLTGNKKVKVEKNKQLTKRYRNE